MDAGPFSAKGIPLSALTLEHLEKTWGETTVLHPLTLDIRSGEFVVLLGPSGCGKTTTMRMIAGLETPTSGRIRLDGRDITHLEPRDRNVAMVFQSYGLYPNMTVLENIGFPLKMRGESRESITNQAIAAAKTVEVDGLLSRKPKELSGGQRQRVALARAIVRRPSLFLLDEPLSNLDARLRASMRTYIKQLHRQLAITTVYVTHDQVEAMTLADRVVVMSAARVQQVGTPLEIYHQPANTFVAGFVGSPPMNLLRGVVDPMGFFSLPGHNDKLKVAHDARIGLGELVMGVRPEHIMLRPANEANGFGTLLSVETTGDLTWVTLQCGEQQLTCRAEPDFSGLYGERIPFELSLGSVSWFDAETGQRR
ncbi:MAG: hypothetical protein RLZZ290_1175 [Pseudomonadota bacterium]